MLLAALAAGSTQAQQTAPPPVALLADEVTYDRESGEVVAEGDVEIFYEGRVLRATRVVYDEAAGVVRAQGPIVLVDPEGGVMLADSAELSADLREGLIEGARLLVEEKLQLAAVQARRRDGRFASLDRVVASTCTICVGDPTPTWAIRAGRVTQDELAERVYFENATLEVFGLPIAYAPRLSIPDPRLRRASGFLAPEFLNSQIYGAAFKLPYYRVLGPSADMTVTPFLTTQGGALFEGEYRRRLYNGGFDLSGVIAVDDGLDPELGTNALRWTFAGEGAFRLENGYVADFDVSLVSDDVFLKQFDYSNADLLTSTAGLRRTRTFDVFALEGIAFQNLLPGEDVDQIPVILPDFVYRRDFSDSVAGGRLSAEAALLGVARDASDSMTRGTLGLDWRRDWTVGPGLRAAATLGAALDSYWIWNNPDYPEGLRNRATPDAALELRWPFVRRDPSAEQVIEPIAQIVFSDSYGDDDVPNEDSELPELSYSNLFSLNRFPGRDRLESGLRANLGIQYLRRDPDGWTLGLTLGRILRADDLDQFPEGSGLDGRWSDYVGEITAHFSWGLTLANRMLIGDGFDFGRNEFSVLYDGERGGLGASYIYLAEDDSNPFLGPQPETSELSLRAQYRVLPNWEVRGNWRYDAVSGSNLVAGGGLTYGNECAEVDLSVSRRYTSSDNLPPATTIGFGLRLAGLGSAQDREWPPRVCATLAGR
jgi:LPS-assembly protein